ncbi:flagellar motor protein MotP [Rubeoparvulum massiliense]|uniref:flagellar motor protein MotP n=1 Tax=Rubeoparvulum massiliense TaxID=1631346 RepID=UPI00065DCB3A|nr:flagellar motor protein MotP [Rubeoparvulum massiliense]
MSKKKRDLLTPIGIFLGATFITISILNGGGLSGAGGFVDIGSVIVVLGGMFASLMVSYNIKEIKLMFTVVKQAFVQREMELQELIQLFTQLSTKARKEGLLVLEQEIEEVDDPFIRKGILLAIDGIEPELIREIMMAEVVAMEERHRRGRQILERLGELGPAWGMIGTLIGLVLMLQTLDDPSTLGPKMALAMVTTFYGAVLANLVFIPMAGKLENQSDQEVFMKQVIIEGVLGVQSGQNPKILEEKLIAFLSPAERIQQEEAKAEEANYEA